MNSRSTQAIGATLLAFGTLVLTLSDGGIPDRSRLTKVTGQLRSLGKVASKGGGLSAVRFSLATDPRHFHYLSQAGDIDGVWNALAHAGRSEVDILIDPADSHSPPLENRAYHMVFEIRIGKKMIRSYSDIVESLGVNEFIGEVLGYVSVIMGIALLFIHVLKRRQLAKIPF